MTANFTLRGIITPLVTPFTPDGQVDESALRELVEFQIRSGVNGLFTLGTTGLGPAIEADQRKKVAAVVVEESKRRVPVIVQVGASEEATTLELARHAEKVGANAIASLTPFYYHPGEQAIIEHYQILADTIELPLLVYNIPQNTGNNVDAKLLLKLSKIQNVVGIKDSSRDFMQLLDYVQTLPAWFNIITGSDSFVFSALCAGAHGAVSATANVFPELFVDLYKAYKAGDLEKGRALQLRIHSLRRMLSDPPIAPLLEALKLRGLKGGSVKPPLRSMTGEEIEALQIWMTRLLPEVKQKT